MRERRVRWLLPLLTALVVALAVPHVVAEEEQPSKDRVAVVNGTVITRADLDKEMNRLLWQRFRMGRPVAETASSEIEREALENLIDFELLCQESREKGIKVDEAALDERMEATKKRYPTDAEYENALSSMDLSESEMRAQFERAISIEQLIEEYFAHNVAVSEEEARAYYDENPDSFKRPEQVRASHILIRFDPQADESQKSEAREKLENIRRKLQEGGDFAALAQEFSDCPSGANGGDLGYFRRGQMTKPFEDAAFALSPGEVSDIVETRFGYHLIKLAEKKAETPIPFEEVREKLGQYLKKKKVQGQVTTHLEQLKEKAEVERFLPETQEE